MLRRVWCGKEPRCCSASSPSTCDGWQSRTRNGARDERIVSFICIESAAGAPDVGARSRRGRSAVAPTDDVSARPLPARATLYARPGPEMAREARARRWAVVQAMESCRIRLSDRSIGRLLDHKCSKRHQCENHLAAGFLVIVEVHITTAFHRFQGARDLR
jgi:hypothetical protein